MLGSIHALPQLLPKALKFKDRKRFGALECLTKQVRDLLSDRSAVALRPSLQFSIQGVREILDIQGCQVIVPPFFLHFGSRHEPRSSRSGGLYRHSQRRIMADAWTNPR